MDYIRDAIEFLKNYDNLKVALDNLKDDIKELKADLAVGQIGAMEYSDMPKGDNPQLPDDKIVNKIYALKVKEQEYLITKKTLGKMDKVLSKLPEDDEKILRAWYIEGLRGESVLKEAHCSERNFYRCKSQALRRFAIQIHGIDAVS